MLNGFKYQELDALIDKHLDRVVDPAFTSSGTNKREIKEHCMKLSGFFAEIIAGLNTRSTSSLQFDDLLNKIDMFITGYRSTLNCITDRHVAVCVGSTWYDFFLLLEKELENKITAKVIFRYGIDQIHSILLERMRKKSGVN